MSNNLNRKLYEILAKVLFIDTDNIYLKEKTTMNEQDLLPMNTNQMMVFNYLFTEFIKHDKYPMINIYDMFRKDIILPNELSKSYKKLTHDEEALVLYNLGKHSILYYKNKKVKDNE